MNAGAVATDSGCVYTERLPLMDAAHLAAYERMRTHDALGNRRRRTLREARVPPLRQHLCRIRSLGGSAAPRVGAARIRAALATIQATGTRMLLHFFLGLCAEAELRDGRPDDAHRTLATAFAESNATGDRFYQHQLLTLQAQLR